MRPVIIALAAVVLIAVGVGIGLVVTNYSSGNYRPSPSPSYSANPSSQFCYVELKMPHYPTLWLQTPRTGSGDASCKAILAAAETDVPAGSGVFESGRPAPSIIVTQKGTLTILAAPGTVSPAMKKSLESGLNAMLGG